MIYSFLTILGSRWYSGPVFPFNQCWDKQELHFVIYSTIPAWLYLMSWVCVHLGVRMSISVHTCIQLSFWQRDKDVHNMAREKLFCSYLSMNLLYVGVFTCALAHASECSSMYMQIIMFSSWCCIRYQGTEINLYPEKYVDETLAWGCEAVGD